ncbi:MAG: hypothetical protein DMD68_05810 [Gemmatimonadetes bacterium]|nr:MAG: hypothetical protein DMD68_05810 [Gemmatimonadota bacterium]
MRLGIDDRDRVQGLERVEERASAGCEPGGHRPPLARRDEETPPASRRHAGLARRVLDRAIHSLSNAIRGLPHRLLPRVHPRVAAERREHGGTLFLRRRDARRAPQLQHPRGEPLADVVQREERLGASPRHDQAAQRRRQLRDEEPAHRASAASRAGRPVRRS